MEENVSILKNCVVLCAFFYEREKIDFSQPIFLMRETRKREKKQKQKQKQSREEEEEKKEKKKRSFFITHTSQRTIIILKRQRERG